MRRPRRPILAACCAALLLATVVMWMRSQRCNDRVDVIPHRGGRLWRIGTADGALFVGWSRPGAAPSPSIAGSTGPVGPWNFGKLGWFDWRIPQPLGGPGYIDVPLWFVALPLSGALYWSWRRKTKPVGFPVEDVR